MLAVLKGCLKAVLARYSFAFKHGYAFVSLLSDIVKFSVHVCEQLVLLLLSKSAPGFAFDLGQGVHGPFHSVDLERA